MRKNRNVTCHAFEAVRVSRFGRENTVLGTFHVSATRSADEAYAAAEALCERARKLPGNPGAFVREINAKG